MDSLANPVAVGKLGGRPRTSQVELDSYIGVREGSEEEGQHHHAGVRFHKYTQSFLPFKQAMRERHGIATHWSTSHDKFWSIVRYLHCTTDHKRVVDRDPLIWTRDNRKLNLFKESQEPFQAAAWTAKREGLLSEPFEKKVRSKNNYLYVMLATLGMGYLFLIMLNQAKKNAPIVRQLRSLRIRPCFLFLMKRLARRNSSTSLTSTLWSYLRISRLPVLSSRMSSRKVPRTCNYGQGIASGD